MTNRDSGSVRSGSKQSELPLQVSTCETNAGPSQSVVSRRGHPNAPAVNAELCADPFDTQLLALHVRKVFHSDASVAAYAVVGGSVCVWLCRALSVEQRNR